MKCYNKNCYMIAVPDDGYECEHGNFCKLIVPEPQKVSESVNHPAHYNNGKHECIDLMREIYGDEAVRYFCICNAYKYRFRAGAKQGETAQSDVAKAEWYEAYVMEHLPMNEMLRSEKFIQSIRIGHGEAPRERCNECDKLESEAET